MSESRICYQKKEFIIISVSDGFIIYNTKKEFKEGHTHLNNFKASKDAITLVINKKIPREKSVYYLTSLKRISKDEKYIQQINELLESKKKKGQVFVNQPIHKYNKKRKKK